uniref:OSJNBa0060B20.5 protein n=1 Tax=Oryza sativa subsp. japonica TaxID=39947 RepID=Q7XX41_ORYSJ|nr:OSJNBa0060B20.5 [Oryza sativa Japonica Group]
MSRGSGGGGAGAVALPAGVGQCDGKSCRWEGAPLAVGRAPRLRCRLQRNMDIWGKFRCIWKAAFFTVSELMITV